MYAQLNLDNTIEKFISENTSFTDKNGLVHATDVFKKWTAAKFASISMAKVTNATPPVPGPGYDPENQKLVLEVLVKGDDFKPQEWEVVDYTPEEYNARNTAILDVMDDEDMSRPDEDLYDGTKKAFAKCVPPIDFEAEMDEHFIAKKDLKEATRDKRR